MKELVKLIIVLSVLVAGLTIGYRFGDSGAIESSADTIFIRDTIRVDVPMVVDTDTIGTRKYNVKVDSVMGDSAKVELPITQKVYEDSTYKAYVSGFDARLDSFHIYQPMMYVKQSEREIKHWSIGIQGGIGITPKGVQPYIGVGVSYNFRF